MATTPKTNKPAAAKTSKPKAEKPEAPRDVVADGVPTNERGLPMNDRGNVAVPRFSWVTNAEGLVAKALIVCLAEEGPKFGQAQRIRELVPGLAKAYKAGTVTEKTPEGRTLTNAMISGRHQYMWLSRDKAHLDSEGRSPEHPLHENAKPLFAAVFAAVKQQWLDGETKFTKAVCEALVNPLRTDAEEEAA